MQINKKLTGKLKNLTKDCRGIMTIVAAFSIFSLVLFWYTMINIGELVHNRILVGNAADNAAQTWATTRARVYNVLGALGSQQAMMMTWHIDSDNPMPLFSPKCVYPKQEQPEPAPSGSQTNTDNRDKVVDSLNELNGWIESFMDNGADYANDLARMAAVKTADSLRGEMDGITGYFMSMAPNAPLYINQDGGEDLNLDREDITVDVYGTFVSCHITGFSPLTWECHHFPGDKASPDDEISWPYIPDEGAFRDDLTSEWTVSLRSEFFGNIFGGIDMTWVTSNAVGRVYHTEIGDKGDGAMFPTTTPEDSCSTSEPIYTFCDAKTGGWKGTLVEPE